MGVFVIACITGNEQTGHYGWTALRRSQGGNALDSNKTVHGPASTHKRKAVVAINLRLWIPFPPIAPGSAEYHDSRGINSP
jgi:hypothetical protein